MRNRRAFLERFPPNRRSHVVNLFLHSVRAGAITPEVVVARVRDGLQRRIQRALQWNNEATLERDREVLHMLDEHTDEARGMADWALAWESLPREEKERIKKERTRTYQRRWMATQQPTQRQLNYLCALGYAGSRPGNRLEASELIDELRSQQW